MEDRRKRTENPLQKVKGVVLGGKLQDIGRTKDESLKSRIEKQIPEKKQMRKISFIRLMRRWVRQIRALELFGEKNRLGRGSDLGHLGGNLCLWGPERFFSVVRNADCTYSLFG